MEGILKCIYKKLIYLLKDNIDYLSLNVYSWLLNHHSIPSSSGPYLYGLDSSFLAYVSLDYLLVVVSSTVLFI
jgi:hypothetical protein